MLVVTLPSDATAGACRLDGEAAEFRVEGTSLSYRLEGQAGWDRLAIIRTSPATPSWTYYACTRHPGACPWPEVSPAISPVAEDLPREPRP